MDTAGLKVVVAAHEPTWVPDEAAYVPVLAGAATLSDDAPVPEGWLRDDAGDNISSHHGSLGELCALYWAWKNLRADWLGLACGRRYLASNYHLDRRRRVASADFLMHRLEGRGMVLPSEANHLVVTNATLFSREHDPLLLDVATDVLSEVDPACVGPWERSLRVPRGHQTGLFVMRRDLADEWCAWLFEVLLDVEASFAGVAPEALGGGALQALGGMLMDAWLDARGSRWVEVSSVRVDGRRRTPSQASYLEEHYRRRYGAGKDDA